MNAWCSKIDDGGSEACFYTGKFEVAVKWEVVTCMQAMD